jgi:DNA polymerase-3 subunit delta'
MPETVLQRAWPLGEKAQAELDDKKRKPSARSGSMRCATRSSSAQRTSAWGRGKVVLVYPAESMNTVTRQCLAQDAGGAAGDVRFVLASEAAQQLLPTIRSRCLGHAMAWPAQRRLAPGWRGRAWMPRPRPSGCAQPAAGPTMRWRWPPAAWMRAIGRLCRARCSRAISARCRAGRRREVVGTLHKLCHDMQLHARAPSRASFARGICPRHPLCRPEPMGTVTLARTRARWTPVQCRA